MELRNGEMNEKLKRRNPRSSVLHSRHAFSIEQSVRYISQQFIMH